MSTAGKFVRFDPTGRWLLLESRPGELQLADCRKEPPAAHKIRSTRNDHVQPVFNRAGTRLLVPSESDKDKLAVWDLSGDLPRQERILDISWSRRGYLSPAEPFFVAFTSSNRVVVVGPSGDSNRPGSAGYEAWRSDLMAAPETPAALLAKSKETIGLSEAGNRIVVGDAFIDSDTGVAMTIPGLVPHPKTYRNVHENTTSSFRYTLSSDGRWVAGRRSIREGYPEFNTWSHDGWRWLFDLRSPTPRQPVVEFPKVQESIFAEFSPDSRHWGGVSEEGEVTIVNLVDPNNPLTITKDIRPFFKGRYVGIGL